MDIWNMLSFTLYPMSMESPHGFLVTFLISSPGKAGGRKQI